MQPPPAFQLLLVAFLLHSQNAHAAPLPGALLENRSGMISLISNELGFTTSAPETCPEGETYCSSDVIINTPRYWVCHENREALQQCEMFVPVASLLQTLIFNLAFSADFNA